MGKVTEMFRSPDIGQVQHPHLHYLLFAQVTDFCGAKFQDDATLFVNRCKLGREPWSAVAKDPEFAMAPC
jgi:hypothetical protein